MSLVIEGATALGMIRDGDFAGVLAVRRGVELAHQQLIVIAPTAVLRRLTTRPT